MERRLDMHPKQTPASEKLVTPNHPIVPVDLDAESIDAKSLSYRAPVLHTDRLLERLTPRRIAEIRGRLASGAYNSPEVMRALAVRLLEAGALN